MIKQSLLPLLFKRQLKHIPQVSSSDITINSQPILHHKYINA